MRNRQTKVVRDNDAKTKDVEHGAASEFGNAGGVFTSKEKQKCDALDAIIPSNGTPHRQPEHVERRVLGGRAKQTKTRSVATNPSVRSLESSTDLLHSAGITELGSVQCSRC